MEPFYVVVFGALAAMAASFELTKGKTGSSEHASKEFWKFRTNYTLVYALMMGEARLHSNLCSCQVVLYGLYIRHLLLNAPFGLCLSGME